MKIDYYSGYTVLSDFINIESKDNISIHDDLIEDDCLLECSSHSSDQSMGRKTQYSSIVDSKNKTLPDGFENTQNDGKNSNLCDEYQNISSHCSTPYLLSDSWFKTWPEKCDKNRSNRMNTTCACKKNKSENTQFNNFNKGDRKLSLDEALENISVTCDRSSTNFTHTHEQNNVQCTVSNRDLNQNEQVSLEEIEASESEESGTILRSDSHSTTVPTNSQFLSLDGKACNDNSGWSSKKKLTNFLNR